MTIRGAAIEELAKSIRTNREDRSKTVFFKSMSFLSATCIFSFVSEL